MKIRDNADRAASVELLVEMFLVENYHCDEPADTVVMDMICNLLHFVDRVPAEEREYPDRSAGDLLQDALMHYRAERSEEEN